MVKIATCGGYELHEDGPCLSFVHRSTGAYPVALFVLGLLTFILATNGVLLVVLSANGQGTLIAGLILLVVAVGAGALIPAVLRRKRAREALPVASFVTLVLDRAQGAVTDGTGRPADHRSTHDAACAALALLEGRPAHYAPLLDAFSGWVADELARAEHGRASRTGHTGAADVSAAGPTARS